MLVPSCAKSHYVYIPIEMALLYYSCASGLHGALLLCRARMLVLLVENGSWP